MMRVAPFVTGASPVKAMPMEGPPRPPPPLPPTARVAVAPCARAPGKAVLAPRFALHCARPGGARHPPHRADCIFSDTVAPTRGRARRSLPVAEERKIDTPPATAVQPCR